MYSIAIQAISEKFIHACMYKIIVIVIFFIDTKQDNSMTGLSMVSVRPILAILVISLAHLILDAHFVLRKNILNYHTIKRFR